jgi:2-polyprenyl-3-methyl-5-hydroxy-6-metoxy-1,4-benzoquinol methylase
MNEVNLDHKRNLYKNYPRPDLDWMVVSVEMQRRISKSFEYRLGKWLPDDKKAKILDVGCGGGELIHFLQQCGYSNVYGIDISASQVEVARQLIDNVLQTDALEFLAHTEESFDLIISMDVIEHLEKDEALKFIELIHKRLADAGRVVLQTPNGASPFVGPVRYGDFTHSICFTPVLLVQLMSRAGFDVCEVREVEPVRLGYSLLSTVRYIVWRLIRLTIIGVNYVEVGGAGDGVLSRVFLMSGVKRQKN